MNFSLEIFLCGSQAFRMTLPELFSLHSRITFGKELSADYTDGRRVRMMVNSCSRRSLIPQRRQFCPIFFCMEKCPILSWTSRWFWGIVSIMAGKHWHDENDGIILWQISYWKSTLQSMLWTWWQKAEATLQVAEQNADTQIRHAGLDSFKLIWTVAWKISSDLSSFAGWSWGYRTGKEPWEREHVELMDHQKSSGTQF